MTVRGDDLPTVNMSSYDLQVFSVYGNAGPGLGTAGTDPTQTFDEGIVGVIYGDIDCGGDWNAGANFYDDPPGIYPRDDLEGLVCQQDRFDPGSFLFPFSRVRNTKLGTTTIGKVAFTWTGKNQGPFQIPTGSNISSPTDTG